VSEEQERICGPETERSEVLAVLIRSRAFYGEQLVSRKYEMRICGPETERSEVSPSSSNVRRLYFDRQSILYMKAKSVDFSLRRRRALQVTLVGALTGIAGCLDSDDEPSPDTDGEDTVSDETESDNDQDDEPNETRTLAETLEWESSYVMELVVPLGSGTVTFYEGDSYTSWSVNGMEMEVYRVGTEEYIVVDGECFIPTGSSDEEVFEPERLVEEFGDSTPDEVVTIDGQEAYRFTVDEGSLYLSTDTGYPIQFESDDGGMIQFHSWGETDPISPPDMDCIEQ